MAPCGLILEELPDCWVHMLFEHMRANYSCEDAGNLRVASKSFLDNSKSVFKPSWVSFHVSERWGKWTPERIVKWAYQKGYAAILEKVLQDPRIQKWRETNSVMYQEFMNTALHSCLGKEEVQVFIEVGGAIARRSFLCLVANADEAETMMYLIKHIGISDKKVLDYIFRHDAVKCMKLWGGDVSLRAAIANDAPKIVECLMTEGKQRFHADMLEKATPAVWRVVLPMWQDKDSSAVLKVIMSKYPSDGWCAFVYGACRYLDATDLHTLLDLVIENDKVSLLTELAHSPAFAHHPLIRRI